MGLRRPHSLAVAPDTFKGVGSRGCFEMPPPPVVCSSSRPGLLFGAHAALAPPAWLPKSPRHSLLEPIHSFLVQSAGFVGWG